MLKVLSAHDLSRIFMDDIIAITPSHLIIGQNLLENMINSIIGDFDMTKAECTTRYKYLKTTIEHFWNRFSQE